MPIKYHIALDSRSFGSLFKAVLPSELFLFKWDVRIEKSDNSFNIGIQIAGENGRTYGNVAYEHVANTIMNAYILITDPTAPPITNATTPCAVIITESSLENTINEGIGMNVAHQMVNIYGKKLDFDGFVREFVEQADEGLYDKKVQTGDGSWVEAIS